MPSTPNNEYLTITLTSVFKSHGTHDVVVKDEAIDEQNANIITFLDGSKITDLFIEFVGLNDNAADKFIFDLTGFNDDFSISIKSENPEDTFRMTIGRGPGNNYSVDGSGVMTINYIGSDGRAHVVTLDPGDASIVVNLACFTPGTLIETPTGQTTVEDLRVGDQITTLDNGPQTLRWVGHRRLEFGEDENKHKPVFYPAGSLGTDCPSRDLVVSPQHKMILKGDVVNKISGSTQTLASSKAMVGHNGIRQMSGKRHAEYISLLLDRHEIIFAEDAATESFRPGRMAIKSLAEMDKKELYELIPELGLLSADELYELARPETSTRNVQKILEAVRDKDDSDMGLALGNVAAGDRIPDRSKGYREPRNLLERIHSLVASFFFRQSNEDADSDVSFIQAE